MHRRVCDGGANRYFHLTCRTPPQITGRRIGSPNGSALLGVKANANAPSLGCVTLPYGASAGEIVITLLSLRPNTSGKSVWTATAGGSMNVPAVVARAK